MKTYITKSGILVAREDANFFTDNNGTFRRMATQKEVEYLANQVGLPEVTLAESNLKKQLAEMPPILWSYLWTTVQSDYTMYKDGLSYDGGCYAFHKYYHWVIRLINQEFELNAFTTYGTSAGFPYDELNATFTDNLNEVKLLGVEFPVKGINAPYKTILTQSDNEEEEIVVESLFIDKNTPSAVCALYTHDVSIYDKDKKIFNENKDWEKEKWGRKYKLKKTMEKLLGEKWIRINGGIISDGDLKKFFPNI